MAAHRQIDGMYQWELSIPPASAAALLSAVCVDLGSAKPRFWGHLLWGPKSWTIRFDSFNFELLSLGRGNLYTIFGLPLGRIVPTRNGSRIELYLKGNRELRSGLTLFAVVLSTVSSGAVIVPMLWDYSFWIAILAATMFVGWFAFAFRWLMPWMARTAYTDFIDELFADHILSATAAEKVPARVDMKMAAK